LDFFLATGGLSTSKSAIKLVECEGLDSMERIKQ
jgi:hypothetical protein